MPIDNKTLLRVRSIVGAGGGGEGGEAVIRSLSVTENGTYTAPSGVDGYSPVTVNVPEPTGTKTITSNGTHDVKDYASAQVNVPDVPAVTESLTVTENGTYTPASGVDGFDSVTVNVAGSGVDFSQIPFASFTRIYSGSIVPADDILITSNYSIGNMGRENVPPSGTPALFVLHSPEGSYSVSRKTLQVVYGYMSDCMNASASPKGIFRYGAAIATTTSGSYNSVVCGGNFGEDGAVVKYGLNYDAKVFDILSNGEIRFNVGGAGMTSAYLLAGKPYHWFLLTC